MSALLEAYVDMLAETQTPNDYSLAVPPTAESFYVPIADCTALGKYALEGAAAAPNLPELPQDPQEALAVVRQWYHSSEHPMDIPPKGTYSALTGYMARLKRADPDLRHTLQNGLGDEQFIAGLRYVFGAIFYDRTKQATTTDIYNKVRSLQYDLVATAFLQDALAIHKLGIDDPAAKAAYFAPEHFVQPIQPEPKPEPTPAPQTMPPAPVEPAQNQNPTPRERTIQHTPKQAPSSVSATNPLAHYINTGKYTTERLSYGQERLCGETVVAGRNAQEQLLNNQFAPDEKAALEQQVRLGEQAQKQLVESRLDVVVAIARNYHHPNADIDDLVQDGNLGLMRAAENFDPQKGSFSSYARAWIKKHILESIVETYPLIRVPATHVQALRKIETFIDEFKTAHGHAPTKEQIVEGTGVKRRTYAAAFESKYTNKIAAIDAVLPNEGGSLMTTEEIIEDARSLSTEIKVLHTEDPLMDIIQSVLDPLDPEANIILALRYGLDLGPQVLSDEFIAQHAIEPGRSYSQEEIAPMLGISRPSVTRRHEKIITLLRQKLKESPDLAQIFFQK